VSQEEKTEIKIRPCNCNWRRYDSDYIGFLTSKLEEKYVVVFLRECNFCHRYRVGVKYDNRQPQT